MFLVLEDGSNDKIYFTIDDADSIGNFVKLDVDSEIIVTPFSGSNGDGKKPQRKDGRCEKVMADKDRILASSEETIDPGGPRNLFNAYISESLCGALGANSGDWIAITPKFNMKNDDLFVVAQAKTLHEHGSKVFMPPHLMSFSNLKNNQRIAY